MTPVVNREMSENKSVIIIGGGLVGSLCACFMAKKSYKVTVYELREDIRVTKIQKGRSINLALSNRGRKALQAVGLEETVLKMAIPMKGRFLHNLKGNLKSLPYDSYKNQCIYSVGRNFLNGLLLTASEKKPNVQFFFGYKLLNANFEKGTVTVQNLTTNELEEASADLIIGADGAYSTLRRTMQQIPVFEFSQTYIPHGYLELSISAKNGHKMTPNHLHIWPRGNFMMIALPNFDNSWTVTLFMPFEQFETLDSPEILLHFFQDTFPDALPLIGEESLLADFLKTKPSPLVSIKCKPYHAFNKFLLIGDAAHAMVPFYGQGMNAGFEDCWIFDKVLENYSDFEVAIKEFSQIRLENAHAICDLAMYNYVEMRDLVMRRSYYIRKAFDNILYQYLPDKWIPLYNSVTFTGLGYKECIENRHWQNKVIQVGTLCFSLIIVAILYIYYVFVAKFVLF